MAASADDGTADRDSEMPVLEERLEVDVAAAAAPDVEVGSNGFGAEYGQAMGGIVNMPAERNGDEASADREPEADSDRSADKEKGHRDNVTDVKTWKPAQTTPNTSRLQIGDDEDLPLTTVQANVTIDGFRARVVLDLYYYNDKHDEYEGTFNVRLPNEASPFLFAFGETAAMDQQQARATAPVMDQQRVMELSPEMTQIIPGRNGTWATVREARIVPKEKAAFAYTETVRRRVDPALMEWSGAGIFSARVFPLLPITLHHIVIGYDVDLIQAGNDVEYRLDLPHDAPTLIVDLSVASADANIVIEPSAAPVNHDGRSYFRFEQPTAPAIVLRQRNPQPAVLAGTDSGASPYFAVRFQPQLPPTEDSQGASSAILLIDTSLSSNPERFNVWLELLRAILDNNRGSLDEFAVLFFNVETYWWRPGFSANTPDNIEQLIKFAHELALEGATDIGAALAEAVQPRWLAADAKLERPDVFLLSDGSATWGEDNIHAMIRLLADGNTGSLFAYNTGFSGTDMRALQQLARETGGAVFSVVGAAEVESAAVAHRARPWRIDTLSATFGTDLLLAGRPTWLFAGQMLTVAGRGQPVPGEDINLVLSRDGQRHTVVFPVERIINSSIAPRIYGQIATGQLEEFLEATTNTATAYARHFRVTGQSCSLLMLETEEDYLRFNIKPEEDAYVVRRAPAGAVVQQALADIAQLLGDPKASMLAWLEKLPELPGVEFSMPLALKMTVDQLPPSAFAVHPAPLKCKMRTWESIPGPLQEMLTAKNLDYKAISDDALRRLAAAGPDDALKTISSLVENSPADGVLARDVAFSAMEWGMGGHAYYLLRRSVGLRPYEPQTYHLMAQSLAAMGHADLALVYYEVGLAGQWPDRFGEFRLITGLDYLRFLRRIAAGELTCSAQDYARIRLESLSKELDLAAADLLIVMSWNTDASDIDLHVIDPNGEECYYSHPNTAIGGHLTRDVTQGYGPEMFVLKRAVPGTYRVNAHYYAQVQNRASARTKVFVTIYEHWGTPNERITSRVVTLAEGKEDHEVAKLTVK